MTISEVMEKGLLRIRKAEWAPTAYLELWRNEKGYGPWATIKEPWVKTHDPQAEYPQVLVMELEKEPVWFKYEGPLCG